MTIEFKKLDPEAVTPNYSTSGSAGQDLVAISKELVDEGDFGYIEYGTGIAIKIPEGFAGYIFPRSSVSKTGHILANSVGVIDSDYRGEIKIRFKTIPESKEYEKGDRVAQLIILPTPKIELLQKDDLDNTERGEGGFGSTGK